MLKLAPWWWWCKMVNLRFIHQVLLNISLAMKPRVFGCRATWGYSTTKKPMAWGPEVTLKLRNQWLPSLTNLKNLKSVEVSLSKYEQVSPSKCNRVSQCKGVSQCKWVQTSQCEQVGASVRGSTVDLEIFVVKIFSWFAQTTKIKNTNNILQRIIIIARTLHFCQFHSTAS